MIVSLFTSSLLFANETTILDEIKVTGQSDDNFTGYINQLKQETSTGSKLGLTIKETPASVEVINSKTMEQRGDTTVTSAITKTTGITGGESGHGPGGKFSVRGFNGYPGITILNDGIKLNGFGISFRAVEVANLDRVEIIRGASSVLNGDGSVGATANLITKKANFGKQESELGFKIGSYDSYRFNFGTGGVAVEDKLAYRVDASAREMGTNIDSEKREIGSLSAGLLYKINDELLTTLAVSKDKDDSENIYVGTPLINGKLDKSVRKINYNTLTDGKDNGDSIWIKQGIELYKDDIEIKNYLYYQDLDSEARRPYRALQITNTDKVSIVGSDISQEQKLIGDRLDLIHKGNIFGLDNKFLIGSNVSKMNFKRDASSGGTGIVTNIYNPISGTHGDLGNNYEVKDREVDVEQIAIYLEDSLSLSDNLKLILGLRHDTLDVDWDYLQTNDKRSKTHNEFSYRAGLVYDLTDTTTVYTSYTTSIEPGAHLVSLNTVQSQMDLTEAEQYEVGLRQSFLDDKGEFTASAYKINKKNMFVNDPNIAGNVLSAGKQSSKGLEFNLGIQPIEQIQIDTNLSIVDTKFDGLYNNGKIPNSVPKYVGNLGVRYMPIPNLGIGTWVRYVDSFYINDSNTIKLPSYTTVDLTLDYTYNKSTTFSFLLKNLTDELYATTSRSDNGGVFLGDSRSFEFGVNYKF